MACEKFKELVECVNTELNKTIKEYEDIKLGYLLYESWINALNDNIDEGDFTPQLCNGSWLYIDFPFHSKRDSLGINIRIQLRISDGKPIATFCDSSHLITFPSKSRINKVNIKRTYPELIKYYDLIIQESVVTEEMFFKEKTFSLFDAIIKLPGIRKHIIEQQNPPNKDI